jgi:anti-anti-sigma regulatory factor
VFRVVFSLFGKKDKAEPARKEVAVAKPIGTPAVPSGKPAQPSKPSSASGYQRPTEQHARQMMQRINAIESEMDQDAEVAVTSRPMPVPSQAVPNSKGATPAAQPGLAAAGLDTPRQAQQLEALDFLPNNVNTNMMGAEAPGASTLLGDSVNALAVEIEGSRISPEIEEAAILYANSQPDAAMLLLQQTAAGDSAENTQQAWALLFDLYQVMGKQAEFDSLSIDYAGRFESSPPAWNPEDAPEAAVAKIAANPSMVIFSETLDETSIKQLDAVQKAAGRGRAVTMDFGQLKQMDASGAAIVLKILTAFRKAKLELIIYNAKRLLAAAEAGVEVGRRDASDTIWQVRLEAMRLLGMEQTFDDVAIDMCVTFEVSPPTWEPMPAHIRAEDSSGASAVMGSTAQTTGPREDRFVLAGEALGAFAQELRDMSTFAQSAREIMIDCRRLRRIDFVAAGNLMNTLVVLRQQGKAITLHEPNNLVLALFSAMGLAEVASIRPRKF